MLSVRSRLISLICTSPTLHEIDHIQLFALSNLQAFSSFVTLLFCIRMVYVYPKSEPIAIVGSGCRFPGKSSSPSKLWSLLANPLDLSKKTPVERFDVDGFHHPDGEHHGTTNATKSYWLEEDHRVFDAAFFNTTPKEAEVSNLTGCNAFLTRISGNRSTSQTASRDYL